MKSATKEMISSIKDYRYHKSHTLQANRILKSIETSLGKTPSSDMKLSDQYAIEVLGHKYYAPWLYVYSAIAGGFKEGWIPDNFFGSTVDPTINGWYGKISNLKPLNRGIMKSDVFPDIASFVNGIFLDKDYSLIQLANVKDVLFKNTEKVVFKLDNSLQGRGIYFFSVDDFSIDKVKVLGNGVFQSFIYQHKLFEEFASNSVATLRITSVFKDDAEVSVRACYLRIGSGKDTHVQSKSHVRLPINLNTGAFADKGYLTNWISTDIHPTSKVPFAGNHVPSFTTCLSTVICLHKMVPYSRCVGWDVTVDLDANVKVMEWNAEHNDIKFSEATQGPCFGDLGWEKIRRRHVS